MGSPGLGGGLLQGLQAAHWPLSEDRQGLGTGAGVERSLLAPAPSWLRTPALSPQSPHPQLLPRVLSPYGGSPSARWALSAVLNPEAPCGMSVLSPESLATLVHPLPEIPNQKSTGAKWSRKEMKERRD